MNAIEEVIGKAREDLASMTDFIEPDAINLAYETKNDARWHRSVFFHAIG